MSSGGRRRGRGASGERGGPTYNVTVTPSVRVGVFVRVRRHIFTRASVSATAGIRKDFPCVHLRGRRLH